jgi:hypothetical protein
MNVIEGYVESIAKERAKILDDFCRAYLAMKMLPGKTFPIDRLELVEQVSDDGLSRTWFFRVRPGRPRKPRANKAAAKFSEKAA